MINCLIVEDEIAGQTILSKKINTFFPECNIVTIIDNKDEAIEFLKKNTVDLVFLDVQLKGGTGLDVLTHSANVSFETIFITAYKEYAIEALNNNASYYLLKPIHDAEFKKGMEVVLDRIKQKKTISTILVPRKNSQIPINVKDILYFKSEGAYSHIRIKNDNFLSSKNIGYYEQLLPKTMFIRTHHSYLVNNEQIIRLVKGRSGMLIMSNGDEIPVAQRRINDLLTFLQA